MQPRDSVGSRLDGIDKRIIRMYYSRTSNGCITTVGRAPIARRCWVFNMLIELLEKFSPQNKYDSDYLALVVFALLEPGDVVPICGNKKGCPAVADGVFKKFDIKIHHIDRHFIENLTNPWRSRWVEAREFKEYKAIFDVNGKRRSVSFSCSMLSKTMTMWSNLIGCMWQFEECNVRYSEIFRDIPEILKRVELPTAPFQH